MYKGTSHGAEQRDWSEKPNTNAHVQPRLVTSHFIGHSSQTQGWLPIGQYTRPKRSLASRGLLHNTAAMLAGAVISPSYRLGAVCNKCKHRAQGFLKMEGQIGWGGAGVIFDLAANPFHVASNQWGFEQSMHKDKGGVFGYYTRHKEIWRGNWSHEQWEC